MRVVAYDPHRKLVLIEYDLDFWRLIRATLRDPCDRRCLALAASLELDNDYLPGTRCLAPSKRHLRLTSFDSVGDSHGWDWVGIGIGIGIGFVFVLLIDWYDLRKVG